MRAASGGRWVGVGAAAALLVGAGAGCAQESDADLITGAPAGFEASTGYVTHVVDTAKSQPFRYSMSMSLHMGAQGFDAELATGAVDGDEQQMHMDLGAMFDEIGAAAGGGDALPPGVSTDDLVMDMVQDSEAMYIHAPFFAALADEMGSSGDFGGSGNAMEVFTSLGDDWGRVDLDALGDVLPEQAQQAMTGGQSASPDAFLDMLRSTGDVEDLGTDEIDGVTVHGLAADVDLQDMLESEGVDPGALESSVGGDESIDVGALFDSFQFPLEVWIDNDNQIRRITFTFDGDSFADIADEIGDQTGEDVPSDELGEMANFEMGMTMDFSDYGDDSISIEAPEDAVDITDDFVAVMDDLYGG